MWEILDWKFIVQHDNICNWLLYLLWSRGNGGVYFDLLQDMQRAEIYYLYYLWGFSWLLWRLMLSYSCFLVGWVSFTATSLPEGGGNAHKSLLTTEITKRRRWLSSEFTYFLCYQNGGANTGMERWAAQKWWFAQKRHNNVPPRQCGPLGRVTTLVLHRSHVE